MSLFTTATKSLPKVVDLFTPGDGASNAPSSSSLVDSISKPANKSGSAIERAVTEVKSKAATTASSSDISSATGSTFSTVSYTHLTLPTSG